jgi:small-conductance mechanosensitive channel
MIANFKRLILAGFILLATTGLATAQTPNLAPNLAPILTPAQTDAQLNQAEQVLHQVFIASQDPKLDQGDLSDLVEQIAPVQTQVDGLVVTLTPRLAAADARLAQLGPPPAPGAPAEDPKVTADRQTQAHFHTMVDSEIKRAKLLSVEAQQLGGRLADERRALVSAHLWKRTNSVLDPTMWRQTAANLPRDLRRVQGLARDEAVAFKAAARPAAAFALGLSLITALLLLILVPRVLNYFAVRTSLKLPSTRLRCSAYAVGQVIVGMAGPALAINLVILALKWTDALSPDCVELTSSIATAVWFAAFCRALGRALLSPHKPDWRLPPMADHVADAAIRFPALIGIVAALSFVVDSFAHVAGLSLAASMAAQCVTTLAQVAAVATALLVVGRARVDGAGASEAELASPRQERTNAVWILAALAAWAALAATLVAILAGYAALAIFIIQHLIWDASLLAALYLLLLLTDDVFTGLASSSSFVGRFCRHAIGVSEEHLAQLGVLASGLVRVALLLFAWAAILSPYGANAGNVMARFQRSAMTFKLGDVTISPSAIVGGVILFLVGIAVTRGVRKWLDDQYLPKTRWDVGARTSLSTAVGYLGVLLAAILGLAYLGISLDRIALIASALSVGIGFGLQAVIGNFVSGLILLAERPIRVGDWIQVGDAEGDVQRINVRATEILRFDKSKLIVPNSDLVSKTVRNITHGDSIGRINITLRISNDADPSEVRKLLLDTFEAHEAVIADPPSLVLLTDIGAGGSELSCYVYVESPRRAVRARSDLMFAIDAAFREHEVKFVSSDRDLYLRPSEPLDQLIDALHPPAVSPGK